MKDPHVLAQQLLEFVGERLTDAPERQYVASGMLVAYDGPQLTTNVTRLYRGQPGAEAATFIPAQPLPISVDIQTVIIRSVSVVQENGEPPTVDDLNQDSAQTVADLVELRQLLYDILVSHELVDNGVPVMLGAVAPTGPQGGVVGTTGTISVVIS